MTTGPFPENTVETTRDASDYVSESSHKTNDNEKNMFCTRLPSSSTLLLLLLTLMVGRRSNAFSANHHYGQQATTAQHHYQCRQHPRTATTQLLLSSTAAVKKHQEPDSTTSPRTLVVVGGGIGGLAAAFDAKHMLRPKDRIIVVSNRPHFSFTPSNPWVAIGKRKPSDIQLELANVLSRHHVDFVHASVTKVRPNRKLLHLSDGTELEYDYLVAATGPRLAFETVPGLKEHGYSVCTTPHAVRALAALEELVKNPGPVVVGATQGSSCFGPAYEYAFLLQDTLRKRGGQKLVAQCPMTLVTSEPYVGHLGLDGAGDSRRILEDLLEKHDVTAMPNTQTVKVTSDHVVVQTVSQETGKVIQTIKLDSRLTMMIPPFLGHDVWKNVPGLTDGKGMILVNDFQQSFKYPEIFASGICVHLDPPTKNITIPIGVPKTGYMIESMGTAAIANIRAMIDHDEREAKKKEDNGKTSTSSLLLHTKPRLNGLCITDFGDSGAIFVTMPQLPPRRHDWTLTGKVATLAKIAFEKYFLHKIESGDTDPYYEKYMLQLIGVERTVND